MVMEQQKGTKEKKNVSEAGLFRAVQNLRLMKGNCEIKEQSEL